MQLLKGENMHSQNNEEKVILEYFGDKKGVVLDLGCNDGSLLSNSYQLICNGWEGLLVDASQEALERAVALHKGRKVLFFHMGLSTQDGKFEMYHSGFHLTKNDISLLSTFKKEETERWKGVDFKKIEVHCLCWESFYSQMLNRTHFDAISIDIEGLDWDILSSINLDETETSLVCVEFNGKEEKKYVDYCKKFGMKLIHKNGENLILAR